MPYIDYDSRERVNALIEEFLVSVSTAHPGELAKVSAELLGCRLGVVAYDFAIHQHRGDGCDCKGLQPLTGPLRLPFGHKLKSLGELNYFVTRALLRCVLNTAQFQVSYLLIARFTGVIEVAKQSLEQLAITERIDALGVLENVKQEFYRRVARKYEDIKIAQNSDVPEYSIIG